jgi:iron complex transport system permease protein
VLLTLVVCMLATAVLSLAFGASGIPIPTVMHIIAGHIGLASEHHGWQDTVIWDIRLPRVVTALIVGASLSYSGVLFQAALKNPLADPFVIGSASGAALGVAVALVASISFVWLGFGSVQLLAFAGSLIAVAIVLVLSYVSRQTGAVSVILAGFAVSTLMVAGMWLIAFEGGNTSELFNWTMGSLASSSWSQLTIVAPLIGILLIAGAFLVRSLNALLLGEDQAGTLGINAVRARIVVILLGSMLTSLAVSIAGIIGFVGLVVPHIVRLSLGSNHRLLLPASACVGAAYLCLADLGSRTLAGSGEMPLGIITALIGAPTLLILLARTRHDYVF